MSGKPARVDTSWNMDANSKTLSAEELAKHVEHGDGDHGREIDTQSGGNEPTKRPEDRLGDINQEPHHPTVVIAYEPRGGGPHEDGENEQVNQDLGKRVEVIDGGLHKLSARPDERAAQS